MPDFEFTSPDGKKYTVSGPDGSTSGQAFQMLQHQLGAATPDRASDQIPLDAGAADRMHAAAMATPDAQPDTLSQKIFGALEPIIAAGAGVVGGAVGNVAGAAKTLFGGKYGTDQGIQEGDALAGRVSDAIAAPFQPRTQTGQALTQNLGDLLEKSGIAGIPIPELDALARGAGAARLATGSLARASSAAVGAEDAAALAGGRAIDDTALAGPIHAPIDYDVPAYMRNGMKSPVDSMGDVPVPDLPTATPSMPTTALDAYASGAPMKSPYGELPPIPPSAGIGAPMTDLDGYIAARKLEPTMRNYFNQEPGINVGIKEMPGPGPDTQSPLDSMIAGNPSISNPVTQAIATVRDDSDISAVLKQFGIQDDPLPPVVAPIEPITAPLSAQVAPDAAAREQVLRDVGVVKIRKSAINADPAQAATELQMSNFTGEPAGMAAFDQFSHERDALAAHAQGMIDATGAPSGLDEASLQAKGQVIAAPYDAARSYFENAKQSLYDLADKRAAATGAPVNTANLDQLLSDPNFKATLMAKDQNGLLNAIGSQYERFKSLDADGNLTVPHSEQYRQWLNKVWSPQSSESLGQVKAALDSDVFNSAGQDVYGAGRRMHMIEKQLLDDPQGISKMFDADPYTPINRSTPYNKIPDAVTGLSPDQFRHVINTYRNFPPELQPQAQQAIAAIKAHYGDKFLSAGTETSAGTPRKIWNGTGVQKLANANSQKIPILFNSPGELKQIHDMVDAGNILHVRQDYPGAAAQAANAFKRGLMSRSLGKLSTVAGGGAGALLGPAGAGAGAFLGEALGGRLATHLGERKALESFKQGIIDRRLGEASKKNQ